MRNLQLLMRVQLAGIFRGVRGLVVQKKWSAVLVGVICVLGAALIEGLVVLFSVGIVFGLQEIHMQQIFPALVLMMVSVMVLISTLYRVDGIMLSFRDYDLLMSLPVSSRVVAASRILMLYGINLTFAVAALIPALIVYGVMTGASFMFYFLAFFLILFSPMVPTVLASLVGVVISRISAMFRQARFVTLILMFAAMLAYFGFVMRVSTANIDWMNVLNILETMIQRVYPPSVWFGRALTECDLIAFFGFAALSFGLFGALALVFGRYMKGIHSAMTARVVRKKYHLSRQHRSSMMKTLILREARLYFSSTLYVFNTGFGLLLSTVMLIVAGLMTPQVIFNILELPFIASKITHYVPYVIAFFISTVCITACSISMEGRSLWQIKSLPVRAADILRAKLAFSMAMHIPFIIADALLIMQVFTVRGLDAFNAFALPLSFAGMISLTGLWINLKIHRFDWTNDAQVIKQGMPVLISVCIVMICAVLPVLALIYLKNISATHITICVVIIITLTDAILYALMMKKAEALVRKL